MRLTKPPEILDYADGPAGIAGIHYFAMAFSVFVEMLNLRMMKVRVPPVKLHEPYGLSHKKTKQPDAPQASTVNIEIGTLCASAYCC